MSLVAVQYVKLGQVKSLLFFQCFSIEFRGKL